MVRRKSRSEKSAKLRALAQLDWRLERKLISYTAAASAAGVAMLACSPLAEAKVVYTQVWVPLSPTSSVILDLNNDGIADFQFSVKQNKCNTGTSYSYCNTMKVLPQNQSNAVWGTNGSASALGPGVSVGSQGKFQSGHELMGAEYYNFRRYYAKYRSGGPWTEATRRYLGLKFIIQGQVHYGWARLDVTATTRGMYGAISGYAYETQPNTPILTGQENNAVKKRHNGSRGQANPSAPAQMPRGLGTLAGGAPRLGTRAQDRTPK
jgi:hypothetical protein